MINVFMDDIRECLYVGDWVIARTVAETKRLLLTGTVNHLALDHDMGACEDCQRSGKNIGDGYYNWCEHDEDGTKLVRWMIETGNWSKQKPTVHSANPVGAARMREMINRYWPGSSK